VAFSVPGQSGGWPLYYFSCGFYWLLGSHKMKVNSGYQSVLASFFFCWPLQALQRGKFWLF